MKHTTTNEVRTTDARSQLGQSCKSASSSCDSPVHEGKIIVRASYSCFTFSENPHEVFNFVCDLLHGLMPAENHTIVQNRLKGSQVGFSKL